ncbi:MAG: type VI secretion system baseplate subunit TssE [Deltaproteobacteria bacterium]|jgi:type VI secretion system protein|nr:type VI secretion system baseplate subunit TssE [Deltaproteobacteria bacterium]
MRLRLLERIREATRGTATRLSRREALVASLEKHLKLILNTRQGTSQSIPDFGMPDYQSLMGQGDLDGLRKLSHILTEVIRKYEPRLKGVEVTHVPGHLESGILEFSLAGEFFIGKDKQSVFFQTTINPDGVVHIK